VTGEAPECSSSITGSGFVIEPGLVMTNAHVVAGIDSPAVRVRQGDEPLRASVVYFDPQIDIALLSVPALDPAPLPIAVESARSGDSAVLAGFPESGPYRAEPARIRTLVRAMGDDIYGQAGVEREVYVFRGVVLPGNSGGPLMTPDARVLGMVFGADEQAEDTGYALTATALQRALAEPRRGLADTGSCRLAE
jgi:S1-C subfamily serine protease